MVIWLRRHCPPDTGFEIRALAVWGRARYLSVTEAPHNHPGGDILSCYHTSKDRRMQFISNRLNILCAYNTKKSFESIVNEQLRAWYHNTVTIHMLIFWRNRTGPLDRSYVVRVSICLLSYPNVFLPTVRPWKQYLNLFLNIRLRR